MRKNPPIGGFFLAFSAGEGFSLILYKYYRQRLPLF